MNPRSQQGFTLLEILLTLTILSIVVISFFHFFTQSVGFTEKNKSSLSAMHLAQETIVIVQANSHLFAKNINFNGSFTEPEKSILKVDQNGNFLENSTLSLNLEIIKEAPYNLYKIHVQILGQNRQPLTETYHYFKG